MNANAKMEIDRKIRAVRDSLDQGDLRLTSWEFPIDVRWRKSIGSDEPVPSYLEAGDDDPPPGEQDVLDDFWEEAWALHKAFSDCQDDEPTSPQREELDGILDKQYRLAERRHEAVLLWRQYGIPWRRSGKYVFRIDVRDSNHLVWGPIVKRVSVDDFIAFASVHIARCESRITTLTRQKLFWINLALAAIGVAGLLALALMNR